MCYTQKHQLVYLYASILTETKTFFVLGVAYLQKEKTLAKEISCDNKKHLLNGNELTMKRTTSPLTHWGRVTHICVNILTIIGSDNGLSPGRRQAIIWTNAGILLIGT